MAELTSRQKKDFARTIYLNEELTHAEIAERVGVKRQTVSRWAGEGNWERYKVSITMTREEQLKNLYLQLAELNNAINGRPEGERFASTAESDTIAKITGSIKRWKRMWGWLTSFRFSKVLSNGCALMTWHAARR